MTRSGKGEKKRRLSTLGSYLIEICDPCIENQHFLEWLHSNSPIRYSESELALGCPWLRVGYPVSMQRMENAGIKRKNL